MRTGKLPPELLRRLLGGIPHLDPRVLLGPGLGEDAAVIDFGAPPPAGMAPPTLRGAPDDRLLIAKTDPITFATDLIGWYAVNVNANDVACAGAVPRWFLATALLPEGWGEGEVAGLFRQLVQACTDLGVTLVGGHTEVSGGLDRPIVVGCMLGDVERARAVRTGGGQPGDALLLTHGIAIEGTALLAREAAGRLAGAGVPADVVARAQGLLFRPGISVVSAARALGAAVPPPDGLHSLHDPTEGGLASGVWEVAEASGLGATVEAAAVAVLPETRAVCESLGLDPYGLLASGALLAAVAPEAVPVALAALRRAGVPVQVIGRLTPREEGLWLVERDGARRPWPRFDRDEVARHFAEAGA